MIKQWQQRCRNPMKAIPGGSVAETSPSNMGNVMPGQGAKFPHASWSKTQSIKQRQYCN